MMRKVFLLLLLVACYTGVFAQLALKSEKGDFEARLIGRALFDGGVFFSDKTSLGNAAEVYDLRLGTVVRFLERWTGKIEVGFAKSKVSMKDIFIEYRDGKNLFRVGHFFEPYSLEYRIGSSDMKFNGAAVTGIAFGDRRKLGASYTYNVDLLNISAGVFSDKDVDNTEKGDEGYALSGRVLYRPYLNGEDVMHIGFSSRFSALGDVEKSKVVYSAGAPSNLIPEKFLRADVTDAINEWRFGAEVVMVLDKWYVQSEYLLAHVNRRAAVENYNGDGWYAQVGYALLNGRYAYNKESGMAVAPGEKCLELLCRYNITNMNDKDAGIMGGKQNDLSVGGIYYFNKYVSAKMSYSLVSLDKHAQEGGKQTFSMIQGRIQLSF